MKVKIVTDGTHAGTRLVDAATGESVVLEGVFLAADVTLDPKGTHRVWLRINGLAEEMVPVELTPGAAVPATITLMGVRF